MAYTTAENSIRFKFTDERDEGRSCEVRLDAIVVLTDPLAENWNAVSQSALLEYHFRNEQVDLALTPDAGSEVHDTAVLRFRNNKNNTALLKIPDPHPDLFVGTTGPLANVIKDLATLAAGTPGGPEEQLSQIINDVLGNGTYILGDGSPIAAYIDGERV